MIIIFLFLQIADVSELNVLLSFTNVTELLVKGNPFCRNFPDEFSYLQIIKEKCPKLEILVFFL